MKEIRIYHRKELVAFLRDWIKNVESLGFYDRLVGQKLLPKEDQDYLKTIGSAHRQSRIKSGIYECF